MTINVPADLEKVLVEEAARKNTTPEALAVTLLRESALAVNAAFRCPACQGGPARPFGEKLGYALRHQGRYAESLAAYDTALKLKPNFPEALEYLGEAYVKMGRMAEARRVLERLRPLDAGRAQELAEEIAKAK